MTPTKLGRCIGWITGVAFAFLVLIWIMLPVVVFVWCVSFISATAIWLGYILIDRPKPWRRCLADWMGDFEWYPERWSRLE